MILLVQIICLCYTLYVLQEYATSGAYSRQHRLLPLLAGCGASGPEAAGSGLEEVSSR